MEWMPRAWTGMHAKGPHNACVQGSRAAAVRRRRARAVNRGPLPAHDDRSWHGWAAKRARNMFGMPPSSESDHSGCC